MNVVREIQQINERELKEGLTGSASWHHKYKDSAWVFAGGIPYDLTEGDILCVLSQWGEIEDINLVRDEDTGKSKGFAFVKYEDQRSTILAVDNMNGVSLLGRTIRVDHVEKYRLPKELQDKDENESENPEESPNRRNRDRTWAPGHAYEGKELKGDHSLSKGVDVWAAPPIEDTESSEDLRRDHSRSPKKQKSEKRKKEKSRKHKKEKKSHKRETKSVSSGRKRQRSTSPISRLPTDVKIGDNEGLQATGPSTNRVVPAHVESTGRPSLHGSGIADWRGVASTAPGRGSGRGFENGGLGRGLGGMTRKR